MKMLFFRLISFNLGEEIKKEGCCQKYQRQPDKGSAGDRIKINHDSFANFLILTANPQNTIVETKYAVKRNGLVEFMAISNDPADKSAQIEEITSNKLGSFTKVGRIIHVSIERDLLTCQEICYKPYLIS
jgi:hypothetical protein